MSDATGPAGAGLLAMIDRALGVVGFVFLQMANLSLGVMTLLTAATILLRPVDITCFWIWPWTDLLRLEGLLRSLFGLGQALPVLPGVVTPSFLVLRLVPGDPVAVIAPTATDAAKAGFRAQLGLDQPILHESLMFLGDMLKLDFGDSCFFQGPALGMVMKARPFTAALVFALAVAILLGAWSAVRAERLADRVILGISLVIQSAPDF